MVQEGSSDKQKCLHHSVRMFTLCSNGDLHEYENTTRSDHCALQAMFFSRLAVGLYMVQSDSLQAEFTSPHQHLHPNQCCPVQSSLHGTPTASPAIALPFEAFHEVHGLIHGKCIP